jgi:hypothetical protein
MSKRYYMLLLIHSSECIFLGRFFIFTGKCLWSKPRSGKSEYHFPPRKGGICFLCFQWQDSPLTLCDRKSTFTFRLQNT